MSETYSVCAFCGAQHHDTITTPCCDSQRRALIQAIPCHMEPTAVCEHGNVARKCDVCWRERELAEAQARIKELEGRNTERYLSAEQAERSGDR